jgi:NADH:ubiquinone oxidoreductase subunit 2 (subunit N)
LAKCVILFSGLYCGQPINFYHYCVNSAAKYPSGFQEDILLADLQGLFWRVASYGLLMLLSLAGIPLTMGFIGKFYILSQVTN